MPPRTEGARYYRQTDGDVNDDVDGGLGSEYGVRRPLFRRHVPVKKICLAALAAALAACQSNAPAASSGPAAAPRPGPAAAAPGMPGGPMMAAMDAAAKGLTDDQLKRFAAFQVATLAPEGPAVPGAQTIAARQAAEQKYGFTDEQARGLGMLTARYYGRLNAQNLMAARDAEREKRIAAAKAAGKPPSQMDEAMERNAPQFHQRQQAQLTEFKQRFTTQFGAQTVALLDKHWPEFQVYYDAMMKRMMTHRMTTVQVGGPPQQAAAPAK